MENARRQEDSINFSLTNNRTSSCFNFIIINHQIHFHLLKCLKKMFKEYFWKKFKTIECMLRLNVNSFFLLGIFIRAFSSKFTTNFSHKNHLSVLWDSISIWTLNFSSVLRQILTWSDVNCVEFKLKFKKFKSQQFTQEEQFVDFVSCFFL